MSVKAKLIIDEKEINVLRFSFGFNQVADHSGRPSQKPVFVGLQLVIETRKDLNLAEWSFSPNQTKQIELHIYPVILGGKTRKLYFYDCYLVGWKNDFSATGSNPMSETLEITCAGVEDSTSEAEYSAYWRTTYPDRDVKPTTIDEDEDKEVTNYYITDLDYNELDEFNVGDTIILHLETKNRIGDKISINLNDKTHDFIYNGEVLKDDKLESYPINNDYEKVELEVISQSS